MAGWLAGWLTGWLLPCKSNEGDPQGYVCSRASPQVLVRPLPCEGWGPWGPEGPRIEEHEVSGKQRYIRVKVKAHLESSGIRVNYRSVEILLYRSHPLRATLYVDIT